MWLSSAHRDAGLKRQGPQSPKFFNKPWESNKFLTSSLEMVIPRRRTRRVN